MTPYATTADLQTWTGTDAPANADALLRSATVLVAVASGRDPYTDTPAGTAVEILRDATTAQAAAWTAAGIDPAAGGIDTAAVKSKKLGSADIAYDVTAQAQLRADAVEKLSPEARNILYSGGLLLVDLPKGADTTDDTVDWMGTGITLGPPFSLSTWRNL